MMYFLIITLIFISFAIFIGLRKGHRRYKKVKSLSEMTKKEFKKSIERFRD